MSLTSLEFKPPTSEYVSAQIISRWRAIIAFGATLGLLQGIWSLTRTREYVSNMSFAVDGGRNLNAVSGLAAQFGISLPSGDDQPFSPTVYADLLRSDRVLAEIFADLKGAQRELGNVSVWLAVDVDSTNNAAIREKSLRLIKGRIRVLTDIKTGVLNVQVRSRTPQVSSYLNKRLLAEIESFNREKRQSRARAERLFAEDRLKAAREEFNTEERRLIEFLQRNRDYRSSSLLVAQYESLQRNVLIKQQVMSAIAERYEQSRIDEVREIPAITIIQPPTLPAIPQARGTIGRSVLAALIGALLASVGLLCSHVLSTLRTRNHWLITAIAGEGKQSVQARIDPLDSF